LFGGLDRELPTKLYMERKAVEWLYLQNPNDSTLIKTSDYLLQLCGRYSFSAQAILNGGGGSGNSVVTTGNLTALAVPQDVLLKVGTDSDAPAAGTYTLTRPSFVGYSVRLILNKVPQMPKDTGDGTYFSKPVNSDTLTYSFPWQTGDVIMVQHYVSGSVANTSPILVSMLINLVDAATIVTDASLGSEFRVTIGGNRTLSNPINGTDGQRITYRIKQDATGSRLITWGSSFRFSDRYPQPSLSVTPNYVDYIYFEYNSADDKWDCLGYDEGVH
jgi:hypothetical protein